MKQARVVYINNDDFDISLNVGSDDGVDVGMRFLVYTLSENEITDPETGESLGFLEIVRGTGKVTHVQPKLCTIESDMIEKTTRRKIVKNKNIFTTSSYPSSTEEIEYDRDNIPFKDPHRGDYARQI